jgi:hypothetical protein
LEGAWPQFQGVFALARHRAGDPGPAEAERHRPAFATRLFNAHPTKTNTTKWLVIASFVRDLSVREVEAALADAFGDQAVVSKSKVSAVCQTIKREFQA